LGQVNPKPKGGRPKGGVRAGARELGIERMEARRATKIASISPDVKEAARSAGLDNNQTALLKVAAAELVRQAAVVREIVAARPAARTHTPPTDPEEPFRLWVEEGRRWLNRDSLCRTYSVGCPGHASSATATDSSALLTMRTCAFELGEAR